MKQPPPIIDTEAIEASVTSSPGKTFEAIRKNFSEALGGPQNAGVWNGGHPFDVERVVVPQGKANYPFHAHASMWEFYWITSGTGRLRTGTGSREIHAGDAFMCPPGEPHQLVAADSQPLEYLVVSDNVMADLIHYPDSGKWNAQPDRKIFRETVEYYDGEE